MQKFALRLSETWALCGGVLLLMIMLVTSINVAGFTLNRVASVFGGSVSGLPGYEDFVSLAVACAALMFLPLCQARRGHVAVDLFVALFPDAVRRMLDRAWLGATFVLAVFLAYWMTIGLFETQSDNVLSPVLGWSIWPFYIPGIISLCLWALVAAIQTVGDSDHV
ncbi:MAG: TRAP transporter small permease [Pseudomonadota bacterium]